jgi:hypothetical protein
MSLENEIIDAGHAKEVLESKVFIDARNHIRDGITAQMASCPLHEQTMHTRLITTLQLWNALEAYLNQIVETGKMAEFQVAQEEKKKFWQLNRA